MIGLGSTSQLGIGIAIRLHDQFSAQASRVNQTLKDMQKNAHSAVTSAMRDYRNNSLMIAGAAAGVGMGMFRMVDAAAEYDHVINQIAILGGKQLGKSRDDLSKFAQGLSSLFPQKPLEIAQIMAENVRQGVTTGLETITRYQVAVGTATNEAIAGEQGVARGLLGIMGSMDLSMDQFPRVANAVTAVANSSMASVYSINEAMQYFANTAKLAGLNVEETLALVGKLSQANIPGSSMGTALANMIRHSTMSVGMFQSPKNKKAWQALGLDPNLIVDLINKGKWFDIIDLVDQTTRGMARQPKEVLLDQIFGVRGNRALVNMFGKANPEQTFRAYLQKAQAGEKQDIAVTQAAAMAKDPWAEIRKIGNAIATFGIQFLNAAKPTLQVLLGVTKGIIKVMNAIMSTPIGKIFAGIAIVAVPLVGILFAFRAAALTATIALRGFAASSAVGGFGGLLRSGLGLLGGSRLGPLAGKLAAGATVGGLARVAGGQTLNLGGKLYKGGQILPRAWASMAGIGAASAAGSVAPKLLSFIGKAGPWIGRIAGFGLRFLPVVGLVWTAVDVLRMIWGETKKANEKPTLDPIFRDYYKNLDEQLFGVAQGNSFYNRNQMSYDEYLKTKQSVPLQQTINLNIDGVQQQSFQQTQNLENTLNNQIDFEVPE